MQFHRTWFTNLCSPACSQRVFTSAVHHKVWLSTLVTTLVHHFCSPVHKDFRIKLQQGGGNNRKKYLKQRKGGTHYCGMRGRRDILGGSRRTALGEGAPAARVKIYAGASAINRARHDTLLTPTTTTTTYIDKLLLMFSVCVW